METIRGRDQADAGPPGRTEVLEPKAGEATAAILGEADPEAILAPTAKPSGEPASGASPDLHDPALYINRELSWLEFNRRVLEEALDESNLLLERIKFLSIFGSNLDEFFMIRVSGLRSQLEAGVVQAPADGMSPVEQLTEIRERLTPMLDAASACWLEDLRPGLEEEGVRILPYADLKRKQRKLLRRHFKREIFPVLTPLAFDSGHPFPHISNLSLNLAVVLGDPLGGERFARLKVPQSLPRLLRIPDEDTAETYERLGLAAAAADNFVWMEEVVTANLDLLFPKMEVVAAYPFRVTRDADFEIEEDEAGDLMSSMAEVVGQRHFGLAVRLEIGGEMPEEVRNTLAGNLGLAPYQVFTSTSPVGLADLLDLMAVERPDLKDPIFIPTVHPMLTADESLFPRLRRRDLLLHHPYDSFAPVVDFLHEAAHDPDVVAIKQTLYRVGPNSPVVQALREAREEGKQVSVLVELKARFDEENNIVWAKALEEAGVHVAYGLVGLKTHAKICLVVRREPDGVRSYVHFGTGNYNPITAKIYTDLGYFTCDRRIAKDVADLFNALTGYSRKTEYRKILAAPHGLREGMIERIDREIEAHRRESGGYLAFKLNSLVDPAMIRALYRASRAGVKIDLLVRGICCLRPQVPGVSDNIRVSSIVGRFLEHTRIYYFRNGGDEEILIGSADLMPRNLDARVEALFPIEDPDLARALRDDILFLHLRDTAKSRRLEADGGYRRDQAVDVLEAIDAAADGVEEDRDPAPFDSQKRLLESGGGWRREETGQVVS